MQNEYVNILFVCAIIVFGIVAYGTFRCKHQNFKDPLTVSFLGPPWDNFLDGWGLLHFGFFALLGYMFPSKLWFSFCLGVAWEMFEYGVKDRPFYISKCDYDTDGGKTWWYGRWQDIIMNSLGLAAGYSYKAFLQ